MQSIEGFDFFPLSFAAGGELTDPGQLAALQAHAQLAHATDLVLVAHGFRNDENDATQLYTRFLHSFRSQAVRPEFQQSLAGRHFVIGGVYWPSKSFRESFGAEGGNVQGIDGEAAQLAAVRLQLQDLRDHDASARQKADLDTAIQLLPQLKANISAQDKFVNLVLSLLDGSELDRTEGLPQIRERSGSELLTKLNRPVILPTERRGASEGGAAAVHSTPHHATGGDGAAVSLGSVVGSIFGKVGQFLNLTTWYLMKDRSGTIGATGTAQAVRAIHAGTPKLKIHLVGHSLGGRLMAGCARSLAENPRVQPTSLTLLEAAFSHYGFSADNGHGAAGFFRTIVDPPLVQGPILETFSPADTVVGKVYALAARLASDNTKEIGDAGDQFGGIGRNGAQKTVESVTEPLHAVGQPYEFKPGVVTNLDGSGGLIKNHSDITNEMVLYAFASAIAST